MSHHIDGLDHAVVAVADLDRAAEDFGRMGFTLTPRGTHAEWGTANYCIMFADSYLVLFGFADGMPEKAPEQPVPAALWQRLKSRGEGLMGLGLKTDNGAAARQSLIAAGIDAATPKTLSRSFETDAGRETLQFSNIALPADAIFGLPGYVSEPVDRDKVFKPNWTRHDNGAIAIDSLTAVVAEPADHLERAQLLFGAGCTVFTDNTLTVHIPPDGRLYLVRPDELSQLHPDAAIDVEIAPPCFVALRVRVTDTEATHDALAGAGLDHAFTRARTVRIPPDSACGLLLEFVIPEQ